MVQQTCLGRETLLLHRPLPVLRDAAVTDTEEEDFRLRLRAALQEVARLAAENTEWWSWWSCALNSSDEKYPYQAAAQLGADETLEAAASTADADREKSDAEADRVLAAMLGADGTFYAAETCKSDKVQSDAEMKTTLDAEVVLTSLSPVTTCQRGRIPQIVR